MSLINVGICGASGKMGKALVRAVENKRYRLRKKLSLNTEISLDSFIHSFNSAGK